MFDRTKRFFDAVWSGGLSTAGGDDPDAGVKIGQENSLVKRYTRITTVCAYCLKEFPVHSGGVKAITGSAQDTIQRHVQQCPKNPLVKQLEAANDAFMLIECLTNDKESLAIVVIKRIHEAAQDGFRATQK